MDYKEEREEVVRKYLESGRKERDDTFRRQLALGPTERRWLGWAGAKVLVLGAYEGHGAPLCPTRWVYQFTRLGERQALLSSCEINFCDDDNILEVLPRWNRSDDLIRRLRKEIENPVLMYHI